MSRIPIFVTVRCFFCSCHFLFLLVLSGTPVSRSFEQPKPTRHTQFQPRPQPGSKQTGGVQRPASDLQQDVLWRREPTQSGPRSSRAAASEQRELWSGSGAGSPGQGPPAAGRRGRVRGQKDGQELPLSGGATHQRAAGPGLGGDQRPGRRALGPQRSRAEDPGHPGPSGEQGVLTRRC